MRGTAELRKVLYARGITGAGTRTAFVILQWISKKSGTTCFSISNRFTGPDSRSGIAGDKEAIQLKRAGLKLSNPLSPAAGELLRSQREAFKGRPVRTPGNPL